MCCLRWPVPHDSELLWTTDKIHQAYKVQLQRYGMFGRYHKRHTFVRKKGTIPG